MESKPPRRSHTLGRLVVIAAVVAFFLLARRTLGVWTDRSTFFLSALALLLGWMVLVGWLLGRLAPPVGRLLGSVGKSIGQAVASDPEVNALLERHPRLVRLLAPRLSIQHWSGGYLTATVLVSLLFAWGFVSLALDTGSGSVFAAYDQHLSQLLVALRTPLLTRVLWAVTLLADPTAVVVLGLLAGVMLLAWGRRIYSLLLIGTLISGVALESLLKLVFERPRPPAAQALIHVPGSFSFPSGHAFASLVFCGLLAFIGLRLVHGLRSRLLIVLAAVLVSLLVGVSRVYLGVHWPSDVLASWLLGAGWLTVALGAFLIWRRYGRTPAEGRPWGARGVRVAFTLAGTAAALVAVVLIAQADPLLAQAVAPETVQVLPVELGRGGLPTVRTDQVQRLPLFSEKLDGTHQEPISLIFLGNRAELLKGFKLSGWQVADQPNLKNLLHAAVSAIADGSYPTAPVTPSFLGGKVQTVAFERAAGVTTIRRRHHVRWWLTPFSQAGRRVWVATASFDSRLELGSALPFPTHHIEPDIDAERDYIVQSLTGSGAVSETGRVRVTQPMTGTNAQGDAFFTEGTAIVLTSSGP